MRIQQGQWLDWIVTKLIWIRGCLRHYSLLASVAASALWWFPSSRISLWSKKILGDVAQRTKKKQKNNTWPMFTPISVKVSLSSLENHIKLDVIRGERPSIQFCVLSPVCWCCFLTGSGSSSWCPLPDHCVVGMDVRLEGFFFFVWSQVGVVSLINTNLVTDEVQKLRAHANTPQALYWAGVKRHCENCGVMDHNSRGRAWPLTITRAEWDVHTEILKAWTRFETRLVLFSRQEQVMRCDIRLPWAAKLTLQLLTGPSVEWRRAEML